MIRLSSGLVIHSAVLVTLVCLLNPSYPAEPKRVPLELVVFDRKTPARFELDFAVNGKRYTEHWDTTFKQVLNFYDRNGDGSIDQKEAAHLPSLWSFRRSVSSGFLPPIGEPPLWEELDTNKDDKVTLEELSKYYRDRGIGYPQIGVGALPHTDELTKAIVQALDTNKDNNISEEEWKLAVEKLAKLDKNDDELIGVSELLPKATYPGTNPTLLLNPPKTEVSLPLVLTKLPLIRLSADRTDIDWINDLAIRTKSTDPKELTSWREKPPNKFIALSLSEKLDQCDMFSVTHENLRIQGWTVVGRVFEAYTNVKEEFIPCESPKIEPVPRKGRLRGGDSRKWLTDIADRNGDGLLDVKEVTSWLDLQKQIVTGQVFLSVYDNGGLFELLDTNHDGALSVRELRNGWQRLKDANALTDGKLDPTKLPRVILCLVSLGSAKSISIHPPKGPDWFHAMDRNQDGDVSRREFTGSKEIFDKIDTNKDDLIDASEAEKYSLRK